MRSPSFVVLCFFVLVGLTDCSGGSGNPELGPGGDGPLPTDISIVDNGAQPDNGTQGDTGQTDTGQTDTGQTDTGQTDIGGTDTSTAQCDPNFGQAEACGGGLAGTKWKYQVGCVADSAFDAMKQNCPTVQVSQVAYSMNTTTSQLHFFAGGSLLRTFDGQITGKALYPQTCAKLGCATLQAGIALVLLVYPGSSVNCVTAGGGACDCSVSLKLTNFAGGQWAANGGVVTVTAAATQYPYYYCVNGGVLTYKGTPQNPTDRHVTYVLQQSP